ncbi:MAG: FAD-dependent oxidoreductase, partial [Clostridia bacterium]|nr:FAD-dependent oxidoreductase [Clostridia bacterium]
MKKYDVAVIGGGFAGTAAALAAARNGAKVILVEKANCLGGSATNCVVTPCMSYKSKVNEERVPISAGIFREIHK